MPVLTSTNN